LELKQIGVLVAVPEKKSNTVTLNLKTTDQTIPAALALFKQSGTPPSTVTVRTPTKTGIQPRN
jgi:hypothetical protein